MSVSLREVVWPRFLRAPDGQLVARLYEPALRRAVRYDRCCAYFSSSVLSAAASGFGAFIARILDGSITAKPSIRLLVNEELAEADVTALLATGDEAPLVQSLLARFRTPANALQQRRLEMLAWLVRDGWLVVQVGLMRQADGILHAKFGRFVDENDEAVVFSGSGNESARGLRSNYEKLEISTSWGDAERDEHMRAEFDQLWSGTDPAVAVVSLPEAVREHLIKFAPEAPPIREGTDNLLRQRAAMLWTYALSVPFFSAGGAATCNSMAPVTLWPHQRRVVTETANAWPEGRLLCDEVGMGKTIEALLILRRLLAGRGVKRALILPPANLLIQWQGELREKGGLRVPRLEGPRTLVWPDGSKQGVDGLADALKQDLLLLSRETARTDTNLSILLNAKAWDLVILDEGHAARRANQVEGEFNTPTLLLGLLRRLQAKGKARSFMILSATPMQTHPWEPWDLLQILGEGGLWLSGFHVVRGYYDALAKLDRGATGKRDLMSIARTLWATPEAPPSPAELAMPPPTESGRWTDRLLFLPAADRAGVVSWLRRCSPLVRRMHRNTRNTLRRYYEIGLLDRAPPRRVVREDAFDFETEEERDVYDAVTRYINRRFDELEHEKAGKGFVMTVYRRRAASSPWALQKSLERRAEGLKAVILQHAFDPASLGMGEAEEIEDLLNIKLTSALPELPEEARSELSEVEWLLERIENLGGLDTKRERLVNHVKTLTSDGRSVLVFTSYADTMTYLRDYLVGAFGSLVASYSGDGGAVRAGSKWASVLKDEVTSRLKSGVIKVLVCTDAASEGLNLQAAGALVNFDLPWNPSRIEQRIGRIDRIGQLCDTLPIVNLYLQDSVDARVYQALHLRCGLFEKFVGPMQPVLSQAIRMLIGKEDVNLNSLAQAAEAIQSDPSIMQAFSEDELVTIEVEEGLLRPEHTSTLLSSLDGTTIKVTAESNWLHRIGQGPLRIATHPSAVERHPEAGTVDGLDERQWAIVRELQQPGERLPLVLASSERGAFRTVACGWVSAAGRRDIRSFSELCELVDEWDGQEPSFGAWQSARSKLAADAKEEAERLSFTAANAEAAARAAQIEAARLRLIDELGRTLICFPPDAEDMNAKFHRLATERSLTAERLQKVFARLGAYPDWDEFRMEELHNYRAALGPSQVKTRLTGSEVDAALVDPRWAFD